MNQNDPVKTMAEIARDAYVYAYPLVLQHLTMRQATNVEQPMQPLSPLGVLAHARVLPGAEFRVVLRPNVDTLYSSGFFDLSAEPFVLTIPATDRYFMVPLYDAWTNVFAVPGTRTTGADQAREFLLVAPGWQGEAPEGLELLRSPTSLMSVIARTQVNGEADLPAVHAVQDGIRMTPLSRHGDAGHTPPKGAVDPTVDMRTMPPVQAERMDPAEYFRLFAELMAANPPAAVDYPMLHRLERIGLRAGEAFDLAAQSAQVREAVADGVAAGRAAIVAEYDVLNGAGDGAGWTYITNSGSYGVEYLRRAGVAAWGLGMNLPQDAIYPSVVTDSDGAALDGAHSYVLRFEADELPPVDAFWSVTAYDADGYFVENELARYALGDRSGMAPGADGAVELILQAGNPGGEAESRWLPVAPGPFNLMLRLYSPADSVVRGEWVPPLVRRVS